MTAADPSPDEAVKVAAFGFDRDLFEVVPGTFDVVDTVRSTRAHFVSEENARRAARELNADPTKVDFFRWEARA